jgi:hypothetical protein
VNNSTNQGTEACTIGPERGYNDIRSEDRRLIVPE